MLFCLFIELILLAFIVLDIYKIINKKTLHNKINCLEGLLIIGFFLGLAIIYFAKYDSFISEWLNTNYQFYHIYLLTSLLWLVVRVISFLKIRRR